MKETANETSSRSVSEYVGGDGTVEYYRAGSVLFSEGEQGDRAYLIESGILEISTFSRDERFVLQMLGPGEIVGEMAIIDDAPRSATVIVIADAKLLVIKRDQLHQRMRQSDPILHMLMRLIMARYRCSVDALKKETKAQHRATDGGVDALGGLAVDKIRMEADLRGAIENQRLAVFYQPIVTLESGLVSGFEALVRWQQNPFSFIPPETFIPLAEETNLIAAVDAFVFQQAVEDIQLINRRSGGSSYVSINVSARQFSDTGYLDTARDITQRAGLDPSLVELEITETQIMDMENAGSWIATARDYGFGVVLDDFGTGYSSLSQLLSLDVSTIKIDRSFVHKLGGGGRSDAMVRGIIALAKSMNLSIIAEGIETERQESMLACLDCQFGQGFRLGRPTSVDQVIAGRSC